jgi:hypothetical protein
MKCITTYISFVKTGNSIDHTHRTPAVRLAHSSCSRLLRSAGYRSGNGLHVYSVCAVSESRPGHRPPVVTEIFGNFFNLSRQTPCPPNSYSVHPSPISPFHDAWSSYWGQIFSTVRPLCQFCKAMSWSISGSWKNFICFRIPWYIARWKTAYTFNLQMYIQYTIAIVLN